MRLSTAKSATSNADGPNASHPLTFPEAGDAVRTARELASKYKPLFDAER